MVIVRRCFCRFDVDEHVDDGRDGAADIGLDAAGNGMPLSNSGVGIDVDVHVDQKTPTALPGVDFLDESDTVVLGRDVLNLSGDDWRVRVEEFAEIWGGESKRGPENDQCGEDGRDLVRQDQARCTEERWADDRDENADECRGGGDGIGAMMPRVGAGHIGLEGLGAANDDPEEGFLDHNDHDEDGKRPWRRRSMWCKKLSRRAGDDDDGGKYEEEADGDGGDRFGAAVAVGVAFIGPAASDV